MRKLTSLRSQAFAFLPSLPFWTYSKIETVYKKNLMFLYNPPLAALAYYSNTVSISIVYILC